jgi:uncharacterized DUF497 family protein
LNREISEFDWDRGNLIKIECHGLSKSIVEEFFLNDPYFSQDDRHSATETRFIAFGIHHTRYIFVAFTLRAIDGKLKIRPISARPANKKEIGVFHEKNKTK